jgi:aminoglycoside phosphotransferase (APT) family kinase protein
VSSLIDTPGAVRDEDAFDPAAVHEWLAARVHGLSGLPRLRQFPGGASNLTFQLSYPDRELILRRPPRGHKAASAHDMSREYRVQSGLKPVFPYVPTMLAFCDDPSVIGAEFYVMERIDGIILRRDVPPELELSEQQVRKLCTDAVDRLIELHQVDVDAAGLRDLGKGAGYVKRQIDGWCDRYERARTDNVPSFTEVMRWLQANQPDDVATCLIHNDYRFDNLVLDGPQTLNVIGILDWELATLGDPLMELGATLSYWVQADDDDFLQMVRRQPTHLPGMMTRAEVVDYYAERTGRSIENWTFYQVYGMFRVAVIMQQLYRRYVDGGTHNPVYAEMWRYAEFIEQYCLKVIAGEAS